MGKRCFGVMWIEYSSVRETEVGLGANTQNLIDEIQGYQFKFGSFF